MARENKVQPGTPPRPRIPLVTPTYFEKYKNALKERDPDKYGRVRNAEMDATIYISDDPFGTGYMQVGDKTIQTYPSRAVRDRLEASEPRRFSIEL